ncbi:MULTISPECIES: hypothetical protein [Streptomyces]|uniref:Lipoprotein n=1 Tax=Streptomyces evansiae TaxID=3075535 RepID=A0ABU2QT03_9ACTN|nr:MULTISPECIES: hypothetical protein [unclassified Streptomyces]MDT0407577.1 hypothetical protein [Streptomyces sp. DSM 41979]MYQ61078.1 hypothetical protein [Streptomyces sp. SID4926]SCD57925.1 hypothetical protein GA0115252_110316 [Streptomyces sp. DfronAA-171]
MKRQRTLTACVALVAASVLVAGCGGDDEKSDKADEGKIAGTETTAPAKPSPTASEAAGEKDGPDLSLPKDLKVVTDWAEPGDADQAGALRDAARFVIGLDRAIARQDVSDEAYRYYSYPASNARKAAEENIKLHVDHDRSVTGTRRLHKESMQVVKAHKTVVVQFCVDDQKYFGKDLKTSKKIEGDSPEDAYSKYEIGMVSVDGKKWVAKELKATTGDAECA